MTWYKKRNSSVFVLELRLRWIKHCYIPIVSFVDGCPCAREITLVPDNKDPGSISIKHWALTNITPLAGDAVKYSRLLDDVFSYFLPYFATLPYDKLNRQYFIWPLMEFYHF